MKRTEMYCGKLKNGSYFDFYPSAMAVGMCGHNEDEIYHVRVTEVMEADIDKKKNTPRDADHFFAWWDADDKKFTHVYPSIVQVEMCFPYGSKAEIELGRGQTYQVKIIEIND